MKGLVDLSNLDPGVADLVVKMLRGEVMQDQMAAIRRQHEYRKLGVMRARPNRKLGTTVTRLDPAIYTWWEQKEGKGVWGDKSARESILRSVPELRCQQEKVMDRVGATAKFGAGYDKMMVAGKPKSKEERMAL